MKGVLLVYARRNNLKLSKSARTFRLRKSASSVTLSLRLLDISSQQQNRLYSFEGVQRKSFRLSFIPIHSKNSIGKCSQLEYTYIFSRKSKHFSKCFLRFGRLKLNVFLSDFCSSKSAEKHTFPIKAWVCDVGIFQERHSFVIEIIQERHVL